MKPPLLFLAQLLPYPPDGGAQIRTYNVLRLLAEHFDITALCFYRNRVASQVESSVHALEQYARVEAFPIPHEHSQLRNAWDHGRSLLQERAYTLFTYESPAFRRRLQEVLAAQRFALAHVDSMDLAAYLPLLQDMPVVCVHHNCESALLQRRALASTPPLSWYLHMQARLVENVERTWCERVQLNVTVSEADRALLQQIAPRAQFTIVPNGVDCDYFQPSAIGPETDGKTAVNHIVFVGGHGWKPNADGMAYFCAEILPLIRQRGHDPAVTWVGRASASVQQRMLAQHGVRMTGYVTDVRPYLASADCYIVPLRIGGGTRLKILDAWASGCAVVSTSIGCEGLAAHDGSNILMRDDPESFANGVIAVLTDATLRSTLRRNARSTAENIYDWNVIGRDMIAAYRRVASRSS